jgi:hypothetical protein
MRFRTREIFLGAFLASAIFAVGVLFASSQQAASSTQQVAASKPHDQGEQTKPPDGELMGSTWLTKDAAGFFTFLLVCVGGIQAWFFWVQLRLIRTSLDDARIAANAAKDSADATKESVVLARSTAEKQLRAYVLVTNITISGVATDATPAAVIVIKNSGQTPAYGLVVSVAIGLIYYPPIIPPPDDEGDVVSPCMNAA